MYLLAIGVIHHCYTTSRTHWEPLGRAVLGFLIYHTTYQQLLSAPIFAIRNIHLGSCIVLQNQDSAITIIHQGKWTNPSASAIPHPRPTPNCNHSPGWTTPTVTSKQATPSHHSHGFQTMPLRHALTGLCRSRREAASACVRKTTSCTRAAAPEKASSVNVTTNTTARATSGVV